MKKLLLPIAILLAMSFLTAQTRYNADIGYYDESLALYYTQVPRTVAAGTYTVVGTVFTPLYPVTLLQGINVGISSMNLGSPNSVKVEIYNVDPGTGLPTGFAVASVTKPYSELTLGGWTFFDFSSVGLSFAAGQKFFAAQSCTNGVPGTTWYGPYLNLAALPTHSYRYFTSGTTTGWVNYTGEWYMSANVEYDAPFHDVSASSLWFTGDLLLPLNSQIAYGADVTNTGDQAETNIPVTIEISDATYPTRTVLFTDTQTVSSLAVDGEGHVDFLPYTFTAAGEYVVTVRSELPTDMDASNDEVYLEQQVVVLPTTLTYDDGTADGAWAPNSAGQYFVNEFECPVGPVHITDLHYYIWPDTWPTPGSTSMGIAVFDDDGFDADGNPGAPGTILYYNDVTCTRGAWNTYNVADALLIVGSGKFFVGWRAIDAYPNCPGMAVDNTAPWSAWKVSWEGAPGDWYNEYPEYTMDWMIRASVAYIEFWSPEGLTISQNGSDIVLDWMDVPEAEYYSVYQGPTISTVVTPIGTDIGTSEFSHINGATGTSSFYKVTAGIYDITRETRSIHKVTRTDKPNSRSLVKQPVALAD